jgi:hypothetical protein
MLSALPPTIAGVVPRGQLYVRLEHDQWAFVDSRSHAFHGAIVPAKHLAAYPPGHQSFGQVPDRVAKAVIAAKRALVVDPGTPELSSKAVLRYPSAQRLRATGAASTVPLPLTVDGLGNAVLRDAFVDATMQDQRLARAVAPPYLEPRSRNDERHRVNLQMLRRVARTAGTQVPIAFIQVTLARLRDGLLIELAEDYAATGVGRIFLRVRGFGENAGAADFKAYLEALDALTGRDVDVVADCVGRVGPLLVHEGALGFSTGTMFFRSVAKPLLSRGGSGGGSALTIESPTDWCEIERGSDEAAALAPCPEFGCPVGRRPASLDDLREHRLHTLARQTREALAQDTSELVRSLRASGQHRASQYADVLAARRRRAA